MDRESDLCSGEWEGHRVAVSTGSFSAKAWAEKRPGSAVEEILNRLYGRYLASVLRLDLPSFPVLATPRLQLRALTNADAPALFRLRSDPRVMHHIPKPLFFKSDEAVGLLRDFQRTYDAHEAIMWAIAVKGSADACGIVGYWRIMAEHHRAEIGYFLDPDLWGQGLMTEAVKAVLDFGFGTLELHSVEAATHPGNTSSMHVLEHTGFVKEGYFKENIRANGEFVDSVVYSRIAPRTYSA